MPNLDSLRAKIKLDWTELDTAALKAKLLGGALSSELGGSKGAEVDRSMKLIGASVEDAGRKAEQAGTAFIKWGDAGQVASLRINSSTARTRGDFDELDRRTRALGNSLETEFRKGTQAVIRLGDDGGASLTRVNRSLVDTQRTLSNTGSAASDAGSGLLRISSTIAPLTVAIVGLGAVLLPVVAVLGAFTVGLAGVLTVMALGAGAVAALAAGVIVLAVATQGWMAATLPVPQAQANVANATQAHTAAVNALHTQTVAYNATSTHTAQQTLALQVARQNVTDTTLKLTKAQQDLTAAETGAHNPLQQLKDDAGAMAQTLGTQAAPMAGLLLGWIDQLIPQVQTLGQSLLNWFGARLPGILRGASDVAVQFFGALQGLGEVLGRFLDEVGARAPQFTTLFGQMLGFGIDAIDGLLKNLLRLSDWFTVRLPTYGPVVAQIMSGIGSAVQGIATVFGALADWTVANWPSIMGAIHGIWDAISSGWRNVSPVFGQLAQQLKDLSPFFGDVKAHLNDLKPILVAVGVAIALFLVVLASVAVALLLVAGTLVILVAGITAFVNWVKSQLPEAGAQFSALGATGDRLRSTLGDDFAAIGAAFSVLGTAVRNIVNEGGRQFSALADAGRAMWRDLGTVFSAIGAAFSVLGTAVRNIVNGTRGDFNTLVSAARQMQSDIGGVFSGIGSAAHGMADAVGGAIGGLRGRIDSGLRDVAGVFDRFAGLVTGALHGFGVTINLLHYAEGGTVPGYAPGHDSVLAALSPGEGILTPQTVRGLGGSAAIDALNRGGGLGASLGDNLGAISAAIGAIGGQCVVFLQNLLGLSFHGNANQWVGAPYKHTQTAAPGELAVFTGGPYGHLAMVTNPLDGYNFEVLDSNWVAPLTIGRHIMNKGMYGFATFLQPGTPGLPGILGSIPGVAALGDVIRGLLSPITGAAHLIANALPMPWERSMANALIDKLSAAVPAGFATGGIALPGSLFTVGELGPETGYALPGGGVAISPGTGLQQRDRTGDLLEVLGSIDYRLSQIQGAPSVSARVASRRF